MASDPRFLICHRGGRKVTDEDHGCVLASYEYGARSRRYGYLRGGTWACCWEGAFWMRIAQKPPRAPATLIIPGRLLRTCLLVLVGNCLPAQASLSTLPPNHLLNGSCSHLHPPATPRASAAQRSAAQPPEPASGRSAHGPSPRLRHGGVPIAVPGAPEPLSGPRHRGRYCVRHLHAPPSDVSRSSPGGARKSKFHEHNQEPRRKGKRNRLHHATVQAEQEAGSNEAKEGQIQPRNSKGAGKSKYTR